MVGVYLSVWVRRGILPHVRGVQVTSVGTGMMGYLGNKGAKFSLLLLHCVSALRLATSLLLTRDIAHLLCFRCHVRPATWRQST